jgi:hypothetical protein
MKKLATIATIAATSLTLGGCALLYPNWGTDQNPSTSESPSASSSASPSASTTASPTPTIEVAKFNIIDMSVDTNNGYVQVVAEVTNVAEDGGKCTFALTSGSISKTVTVKAEANVSTTQCFPAMLPITGFPKGKATVTIAYASSTHEGTTSTGVTIP